MVGVNGDDVFRVIGRRNRIQQFPRGLMFRRLPGCRRTDAALERLALVVQAHPCLVKRALLLAVRDGRIDSHPHAELQQPSFGIHLFECFFKLGFTREQSALPHAQDPEPVPLMIVTANESDRFQDAGELFRGGAIDGSPKPGFGDFGSS